MSAELLVPAGAVELALGATLGWVVALGVDRPELMDRLGVRSARRIGQAHLDFIIMGVLLMVAGLAAPGLPGPAALVLAVGAWVNAALFLPLAWWPDLTGRIGYKVVSVVSFACMTTGTIWLAVHLLP